MNKTLKKMRARSIKNNFRQFLSVVFIVLLATMLFSGFITNSKTLKSSVNNYFDKTNLADLWVHTTGVTQEDEQFFIDNGIEFNKRIYFETVAEIEGMGITNAVRVYVCKADIHEPYSSICNPYIISGKAGPGNGCLIDQNVAQDNNIRAGLESIKFSYEAVVDGNEVVLDFEEHLTGTMSLDECADSYTSWILVIEEGMFEMHLKQKLTEEVVGFDADNFVMPYNQILVNTDDVEKTSAIIKEYYAKETTESELLYLFGRESIESVQLLNQEIKQSRKMIYVFPIMFLLVAVLIILTTIDQLVVQEQKRIGILKCSGVPNSKILNHYSLYGSILCFIGAAVGTFLGAFFIPEVMFSRYGKIYSIPAEYIKLAPPVWVLVGLVALMAVLGYVVSLTRCYKIVHKNPIECLRYDYLGAARKLRRNTKNKKFKKLPIPLKMAIRNIKIKPIRTLMTSVGIMGCVTLLLAGFGIGDTLSKSLRNDLGGVFKYDVSSTYKTDDFKEKLLADSRVEYVEDYSKVYVGANSEKENANVYVYKIQENSKISKIKLSGEDVCVSKSIAEKFGLKIGDNITVFAKDRTVELKITKIVNTSFMNGIYVCRDLNFSPELVMNGVFVDVESDAKGVVEFANTINGTKTAKTIGEERAYVESRIMTTSTMTKTIKVFACLLAIIVLLNVIFLIVRERNIEIATLKVMGLNSWQVSVSVIYEVLFMSIIGIIGGLIFGYPLIVLILSVNKIETLNYVMSIHFLSIFASIFIVLFTIFSVLLICYFKIRKVDMTESLKRID